MSMVKASTTLQAEPKSTILLNDQEIAALTATADGGFFNSNKKTTTDYRTKLAHAVGSTGTIEPITSMVFGTGGEVDDQGNPAPPSDNGALQHQVYETKIKSVTYPQPTTACFEAEILKNTITAAINEVGLKDRAGVIAAKARMLTSKGTDAESGLNFKWYMEF